MNEPKPLTKEDVHKKVKIDGQFRLVEEYCYAYKVKSAVEWYKKYRNNPHGFKEDYPDIFNNEYVGKYNLWTNFIVNKAFEGVIEDN